MDDFFNKTNETPTEQPINTSQQENRVFYNTNYNTNYDKSKNRGCLYAFLGFIAILIFCGVAMAACTAGIMGAASSLYTEDESETVFYPEGDYVEMLYIEGTITEGNVNAYGISEGYQHQWTLNEIDLLAADENNKGILLYINSGGGGTYESDELYLALKEYKELTGRPVYAYYAQTAASGAVYISMAADEIYSNRMTMTGSIGVKISNYDITGLMEKLGVKETTIVSGKNKNMFSPTTAATDEQIAIYQGLVDESYQIFVGIVAEERGIPLEKAIQIADGRVYTPQQALELNLIDGIMSFDDFITTMENKPEFADCEIIEAQYTSSSVFDWFFSSVSAMTKNAELDLLNQLVNKSGKTEFSID